MSSRGSNEGEGMWNSIFSRPHHHDAPFDLDTSARFMFRCRALRERTASLPAVCCSFFSVVIIYHTVAFFCYLNIVNDDLFH